MSIAKRWPALADQLAVAETLYGDGGFRRVADWLDEQLGYVGNADFAAQFSDHIELPGIAPIDYAHRTIRTRRGELLGGIRFYGRDIGRPFVDVVAHSFESNQLGDDHEQWGRDPRRSTAAAGVDVRRHRRRADPVLPPR